MTLDTAKTGSCSAAAATGLQRRQHGAPSSSSAGGQQDIPLHPHHQHHHHHHHQQQQQHLPQRRWHLRQQQASQLHQQLHNQQHQQRRLYQEFCAEHYSASSKTHDGVFFFVHFIMTAVHKRLLVSQREHVVFNTAMLLFAGALIMRTWAKHVYHRTRPLLVLVLHIALTVLRASAVNSMSSKQAVHFKNSFVAGTVDTAGSLFLTILAVLGGPFRLFEMLGLQQTTKNHAVITALYLAVHPLAALHGIRLAYSNAMFFQLHQVHDTLSAVVDSLLSALIGLPPLQQQTCSSCAGFITYMTLCLFASVAAPLYIVYYIERAAWSKWLEQRAAAAAAAAARSRNSSSGSSSGNMLLAGGRLAAAALPAPGRPPGAATAAAEERGGAADAAVSQQQRQRNQLVQQHLFALCDRGSSSSSSSSSGSQPLPLDCQWGCPAFSVASATWGPLAVDHFLPRGLVHMLVLACLLIASWVASNAFAMLLLPRVLSARQLAFWCPNRPYAPYVIAGQVYDG